MKFQKAIVNDQRLAELLRALEAGDPEDKPVGRLLRIHEAIRLELLNLEADFPRRLEESIQQAEARLKQQFSEGQAEKIRQTEEDVISSTEFAIQK